MKKKIAYLAVLTAALAAFNLYSCRKATDALTSEDATQTSDATKVQSESDQSNNDANNAMSSYVSLSGKMDGAQGTRIVSICDATINVSDSGTRKLTVTYNGTGCYGRTRTGQITLQLLGNATWKTQGAQILVTYTNFKVVYPNGKSVEFNGTKTITNVNGGNYWTLTTGGGNLVIRERMMNMQVTFDNGSTATWNSARLTTVSYSNLVFTYSTNGDTTINSNANTVMWGTDRVGNPFSRYLASAVTGNTDCGLHHPTAGATHDIVNGSDKLDVTFGTDASGNVVSSGCPGYFKVTWTNAKGKTNTAVISY